MFKDLGQACNITTGKLDANESVSGGCYPFFTCSEHPDVIDHYAFDDDVVLIAGNNAKGNFHVSRYKGKFNAYQRTYILTAKNGYDIDYVYYALKLELKRLRERSQGSQTKFLTMPLLNGIRLNNLTHSEQTAISRTLKILDAKIELNNRINAELESMAKTLYDYWFVQFDFPDVNGKPYKATGGKMVYNHTLKREIPDGWLTSSLEKQITFKRGISYSSANICENGTPLINLNSFSLLGEFKYEGTKYFKGNFKNESLLKQGDLVIAITDVTRNADIIGKSFVIPDVFDTNPLMSCDVASVSSNSLGRFYLEHLFNSTYYHNYIKHFASGTLVLHLDLNGVNWFETIIPPNIILNRYESACESLFIQRNLVIKENLILEKLRDWLLPMLMNGQVKVQ